MQLRRYGERRIDRTKVLIGLQVRGGCLRPVRLAERGVRQLVERLLIQRWTFRRERDRPRLHRQQRQHRLRERLQAAEIRLVLAPADDVEGQMRDGELPRVGVLGPDRRLVRLAHLDRPIIHGCEVRARSRHQPDERIVGRLLRGVEVVVEGLRRRRLVLGTGHQRGLDRPSREQLLSVRVVGPPVALDHRQQVGLRSALQLAHPAVVAGLADGPHRLCGGIALVAALLLRAIGAEDLALMRSRSVGAGEVRPRPVREDVLGAELAGAAAEDAGSSHCPITLAGVPPVCSYMRCI
jgi:hypothetical protein